MVSDGDSKAFSAVGNIYDDVKVVKIDYALQKMSFLNCVTVTQNMCTDGFLHAILRQNILARDDV